MSSTLRVNTREYYEILKTANFIPASYLEIAESLMKNGIREMYHALVNEDDIDTLFSIPNLKIFWVCRCHHIADDGSTAHEHLHALVQYQNKKTHRAFKDRLKRSDQLLNPKTTFKKILCPDHVVGVLRYITCRDGQRATRRNADGLMGVPHTHYKRSVFGRNLLHRRNRKQILGCKDVRRTILRGVSIKLSEVGNLNMLVGILIIYITMKHVDVNLEKLEGRRRKKLMRKEEHFTKQSVVKLLKIDIKRRQN